MPSTFLAFLAPVAFLLPAAQAALPSIAEAPVDADALAAFEQEWQVGETLDGPPFLSGGGDDGELAGPASNAQLSAFDAEPVWQVRIEQRLIIRIAPRTTSRNMLLDTPSGPIGPRFYERKTGRCLSVQGIAGVQVADDRLVLYMRDRRIIGANLEKSCRPRDFYSGFYVEQTSDGQICAGRDQVHSRAGTTCSISSLRELIPND